jgi:hypothetical protein
VDSFINRENKNPKDIENRENPYNIGICDIE